MAGGGVEDLVPVFLKMDPSKLAEIFSNLDTARAAKLSKMIQDAASKVEEKIKK